MEPIGNQDGIAERYSSTTKMGTRIFYTLKVVLCLL